MEKTNTDAYEIEINCPATEVKVLNLKVGDSDTKSGKPGTFKHKPSFQK
jgi:hypothetical protein